MRSELEELRKPTLARGEGCANRPVSELRDEIIAAISQILETEDLKPGNEANLRKILKEMRE